MKHLLPIVVWLLVFLVPISSWAFCGFYVSGSSEGLYANATRVALMRAGTRTVLSMSNDYRGPARDFAMVIPVPVTLRSHQVQTLSRTLFERLDQQTAPRLVEYWERDPCPFGADSDAPRTRRTAPGIQLDVLVARQQLGRSSVRVEAQFVTGEYQIAILSSEDSNGLEQWLRAHEYRIPEGAAAFLAPYVRGGWRFFVARVAMNRVSLLPDGTARLSPLRFYYDSHEFRLPIRLGLLNAGSTPQDLLIYILHSEHRFEVANRPNAFIPTNLDVRPEVLQQFPAFYAQLFDASLAATNGRAVITEYSWNTSSCDPCTGPTLTATELASLGADVLPQSEETESITRRMNVTRLHARYNAATFYDDLVFREASPVQGGREIRSYPRGVVPTGVQPSTANSFQARYVVRHPWEGPILCQNPQRGHWGPPTSARQSPPVSVAQETATAQRTSLHLPSVVLTPVRGVDLTRSLQLPAVPNSSALEQPTVIPARGIQRGCACSSSVPANTESLSARIVMLGMLWFLGRRKVHSAVGREQGRTSC